MPEVIDLITSSPEVRPRRRPREPSITSLQNSSPLRTANTHAPSDDIFSSSLFDYDNNLKPAKKRRVASTFGLSPARNPTSDLDPLTLLYSPIDGNDNDIMLTPKNGFNRYSTSRINNFWNGDVSDPISSSLPDPGTGRFERVVSVKRSTVITIEDSILDADDEELPSPGFVVAKPRKSNSQLSERTANLLARLSNQATTESKSGKKGSRTAAIDIGRKPVKLARQPSILCSELDDDSPDDSVPKPKAKRPAKTSSEAQIARAAERAEVKARKELEREVEKERKRLMKEQKAKEKQLAADIAEVNKAKVDKKTSTPEMIVDLPSSLEGSIVGNQVTEFMKNLGAETSFSPTRIPNMVTWRRKVSARLNEEAGHWEPCPLTIAKESHVLCLVLAEEFVDMALAAASSDQTKTLQSHVLKIRNNYPNSKPIYLIEGLAAWMRKNKNTRNRAYQAAIRRELNSANNDGDQQQPKRTRKAKNTEPPRPPIDEDTIEDALLQLQVQHGCLIHHTAAAAESAEWIKNFTEHISTIPYRQERMNIHDAAFCMDVGQVKCGLDKTDTYIKMLEEITRVTTPIAYGISVEYPSVRELVTGMKAGGPLALENVKRCANRSGGLTETRIGPAISRRLHKTFTGLDPSSTDI
ncbi:hypothetical protein AJ80_09189 [Polytolypa hystricis UAMH7299]|uniref:ERCC4 domain-containing protein n=1 Tax=Polytolypa hystricis (strain UAMH7299) TaxID=1447883 RepID=A0A2B7WLT8_POLH7|nr:hypothetical protein AJ80_09189 [Polytolypa hystricis UAMH7299]